MNGTPPVRHRPTAITKSPNAQQHGEAVQHSRAVQPPSPVPKNLDSAKFIGARFERPKLTARSLPVPRFLPWWSGRQAGSKIGSLVNPPKEGADFHVQMVFDMPSPKNTGN